MQTFMTYLSHPRTMADLDRARLGKQRVEAKQILMMLSGDAEGPNPNHPAVRMWEGYEPALILYGLFCCHEWRIVRGYEDSLWGEFAKYAKQYGMLQVDETGRGMNQEVVPPPWARDKWVLRSHRSNLMAKLPGWYAPKYDGTPTDMPYLWPVPDKAEPRGYYLRLSRPDANRLETGERVLPSELDVVEHIPSSGIRESYRVLTPEED